MEIIKDFWIEIDLDNKSWETKYGFQGTYKIDENNEISIDWWNVAPDNWEDIEQLIETKIYEELD